MIDLCYFFLLLIMYVLLTNYSDEFFDEFIWRIYLMILKFIAKILSIFFLKLYKNENKEFWVPLQVSSPLFHFQSIKIILRPSNAWLMRGSTQQPSVIYWRLFRILQYGHHRTICHVILSENCHFWKNSPYCKMSHNSIH